MPLVNKSIVKPNNFNMPRVVRVAATQFACTSDFATNVASAVSIVREAAEKGANVILLQELFEGLYFCQEQDAKYFEWASVFGPDNSLLNTFVQLARELHVVSRADDDIFLNTCAKYDNNFWYRYIFFFN